MAWFDCCGFLPFTLPSISCSQTSFFSTDLIPASLMAEILDRPTDIARTVSREEFVKYSVYGHESIRPLDGDLLIIYVSDDYLQGPRAQEKMMRVKKA